MFSIIFSASLCTALNKSDSLNSLSASIWASETIFSAFCWASYWSSSFLLSKDRASFISSGRAAYNLAYLYLDGSVVAKDNDKALEYANKALSLGVNEAEQLIEQIEKNKDGYFGYSAYR